MADFLSTGVSGLLAFQRALNTTSHNISNVSTDGYSRQRVLMGTRPAQGYGNGWLGQGVNVQTTQRVYDSFVAAQTRGSASNLEHLDIYASNAERLNNMFGDSANGLSATLQKFVNAFQSVANSPASIPARQVLLSEANTLQQRLKFFDGRLDEIGNEMNARIKAEVAEINSIAQGIARLNNDIQAGYARTGGQPPNDLLDQRDRLLDQLAEKISVNAVVQDGGTVNVFVGSGQPLVLGADVNQLTTIQDSFDSTQLTVALQTPGSSVDISRNISGGSLGGLLDFRSEQLDPAHNALGRIAAALTDVVNTQHREGMDLSGALGGDFFAVGGADVLDNSLNSGSGTVAATRANIGATDRPRLHSRNDGRRLGVARFPDRCCGSDDRHRHGRRSVCCRRPRDRGRRGRGRRRHVPDPPDAWRGREHGRPGVRCVAHRGGSADPHRRGCWKFRLRLDLGRRSARQHERGSCARR